MKVHILQKVELAVLGFAALIAIAAMVFYFTRDWIQFSPAALLWLPYPLLPYVVLGGVGYLLNRRKKLLRRAVITLAGSLVLLGLTAWFYVQFMDDTLVFYLSWTLGISGILLGGVAVAFLLLSWLSGVGVTADAPDIRIPADTL